MKTQRLNQWFCAALPCLGTAALLTTAAEAGNRHFTYSYETTTLAQGAWEFENWATWKTGRDSEPDLETFDFRHELEYGVTDRLQLAFYLSDWTYEDSASEDNAEWEDVAVEAIYNLTDPNSTPFGSALYGEVKAGDGLLELEGKLLLQKNIGDWKLVYNIGGELEWEDDYEEDEAELFQTAGVCYQLNPCWTVGAELVHEIAVPDVDEIGDSGVFVGPNVAWHHDRYWAALTGLWQATSLDDEPDFQLRGIFSIAF